MAVRTLSPGIWGLVKNLVALVNQLSVRQARALGTNLITTPAAGMGSTKDLIATGAFSFRVAGVTYAKAAVTAGTSPGTDVVPQDTYGAVALDIGADGTLDLVKAAANATGYATAALALAGIAAPGAGHLRVCTVTVISTSGAFTFDTTLFDAANTTVVFANGVFDADVDSIVYRGGGTPA